jgi:phage/plasmid-like protein (TIGR03299 family)
MAYAGDVPWHGLGKAVPSDLTPAQMLKAAGLDWEVHKDPAFIEIDGKKYPIPRCALRRSSDNKILDTVTPHWNPLQNEEAFDFFKKFVIAGDMEMHTAGSLKGGQLVWGLAKIKDGFFVGKKKDEVQSHMLFTNPHQFGKAIDIRFTPIRVVCWNTLSMAIGSGKGLTIDQQVVRMSHRRPFDANLALQTLGIAHDMLMQYKEAANFIATRRFTDETLNQYFRDIFPKSGTKDIQKASRNHERALAVIGTQPGHDMEPGTWWQAFNCVTYMTDHLLGREADTRMDSAWFGSNRALKSKALNEAVKLAELSPAI